MRITWDEQKRLSNIRKHGIDFAVLNMDWFANAHISPARSTRFIALGLLGNDVVVVVFSRLGSEAISIISMRRANRRERMS